MKFKTAFTKDHVRLVCLNFTKDFKISAGDWYSESIKFELTFLIQSGDQYYFCEVVITNELEVLKYFIKFLVTNFSWADLKI